MNAYHYPTPEQLDQHEAQLARIAERNDSVPTFEDFIQSLFREPSFVWITHNNKTLLVEDMATPHIFYSLRMLFNHTVPPVFRVLAAGEQMNRYDDIKHWHPDYKRRAIIEFTKALIERGDLDRDLQRQWEDIQANAKVILALGL